MLGDNLYYSFVMELEVATNDVAKRCNRGEILIREGGLILIRSVYIFFNVRFKLHNENKNTDVTGRGVEVFS